MLRYKIDVLKALKEAGYNSTRILRERVIPQSSVQKLRHGQMIGHIVLDQVCELLQMQPGDLIEWVPSDQETKESPQ